MFRLFLSNQKSKRTWELYQVRTLLNRQRHLQPEEVSWQWLPHGNVKTVCPSVCVPRKCPRPTFFPSKPKSIPKDAVVCLKPKQRPWTWVDILQELLPRKEPKPPMETCRRLLQMRQHKCGNPFLAPECFRVQCFPTEYSEWFGQAVVKTIFQTPIERKALSVRPCPPPSYIVPRNVLVRKGMCPEKKKPCRPSSDPPYDEIRKDRLRTIFEKKSKSKFLCGAPASPCTPTTSPKHKRASCKPINLFKSVPCPTHLYQRYKHVKLTRKKGFCAEVLSMPSGYAKWKIASYGPGLQKGICPKGGARDMSIMVTRRFHVGNTRYQSNKETQGLANPVVKPTKTEGKTVNERCSFSSTDLGKRLVKDGALGDNTVFSELTRTLQPSTSMFRAPKYGGRLTRGTYTEKDYIFLMTPSKPSSLSPIEKATNASKKVPAPPAEPPISVENPTQRTLSQVLKERFTKAKAQMLQQTSSPLVVSNRRFQTYAGPILKDCKKTNVSKKKDCSKKKRKCPKKKVKCRGVLGIQEEKKRKRNKGKKKSFLSCKTRVAFPCASKSKDPNADPRRYDNPVQRGRSIPYGLCNKPRKTKPEEVELPELPCSKKRGFHTIAEGMTTFPVRKFHTGLVLNAGKGKKKKGKTCSQSVRTCDVKKKKERVRKRFVPCEYINPKKRKKMIEDEPDPKTNPEPKKIYCSATRSLDNLLPSFLFNWVLSNKYSTWNNGSGKLNVQRRLWSCKSKGGCCSSTPKPCGKTKKKPKKKAKTNPCQYLNKKIRKRLSKREPDPRKPDYKDIYFLPVFLAGSPFMMLCDIQKTFFSNDCQKKPKDCDKKTEKAKVKETFSPCDYIHPEARKRMVKFKNDPEKKKDPISGPTGESPLKCKKKPKKKVVCTKKIRFSPCDYINVESRKKMSAPKKKKKPAVKEDETKKYKVCLKDKNAKKASEEDAKKDDKKTADKKEEKPKQKETQVLTQAQDEEKKPEAKPEPTKVKKCSRDTRFDPYTGRRESCYCPKKLPSKKGFICKLASMLGIGCGKKKCSSPK